MSHVLAIAQQKGGVGKTTTACNIATVLARLSKSVALVDFDPQGNVALSFNIDKRSLGSKTIFGLIVGETNYSDTIIKTEYGVDIIPSNIELADLDATLEDFKHIFPQREEVLKDILEPLQCVYDYILIDLPPSLNNHTWNGLTAADEVLIPVQCEYFATDAMIELMSTISKVREKYNPYLDILGVIGTMSNCRTNDGSIALHEMRKYCADHQIKMFDTVINRSVRFSASQRAGIPTVAYAPNNLIVQDYERLVQEVFFCSEEINAAYSEPAACSEKKSLFKTFKNRLYMNTHK